jgi:hypothetical protein
MALVKVRTGPTSYLKMTEKDAKAYRKEHGEYGVEAEPEAKAEEQPAENKQRRAPAAKKADDK